MSTVPVRIIGRRLPGRSWSGRSGIHIGVQRGSEVVGVLPGDTGEAVFDVEVDVEGDADATGVDFRGPYVHGRRGERFLYLVWGEVDVEGTFTMFRRLKLQLNPLVDEHKATGVLGARRIHAFLELTDTKGRPVAASVRPPWVLWRVD
jgi:hypothetical protein